jgi:hypothetical protein
MFLGSDRVRVHLALEEPDLSDEEIPDNTNNPRSKLVQLDRKGVLVRHTVCPKFAPKPIAILVHAPS